MKKNIILGIVVSTVVMLMFPWLAVTDNRCFYGKKYPAFMEPSDYFSNAVSDRYMDIL